MAAKLISVKWRDAQGRETTLSYSIGTAYSAGDAELTALLQALQNMSQAEIVEAHLMVPVVVTGLTGAQPVDTGSFDSVADHCLIQFDRADLTGKIRATIPAPLDTIFLQTGTYALQDLDTSDSLVIALVAAGITEPVLVSPQDTPLTLDKGWRRGLPHS